MLCETARISELPSIKIFMSDTRDESYEFSIQPKNYFGEIRDAPPRDGYSKLYVGTIKKMTAMVLGAPFFREYHTVFDL